MGQRVKLRAISDSIPNTGVFGPKGEYPAGTIMTLPDDQPFIGSGYERHELLDGEKTGDHEAVTNPANAATSGTDGGGHAKDAGQTQDAVISEGAAVDGEKAPTYTVVDTGSPGWKEIQDADGKTVKKVRPREADEFETLDAAAKAKFLAD